MIPSLPPHLSMAGTVSTVHLTCRAALDSGTSFTLSDYRGKLLNICMFMKTNGLQIEEKHLEKEVFFPKSAKASCSPWLPIVATNLPMIII